MSELNPSEQVVTTRVVQFSGGLGSWATAKRVVERHGKEGVILLFADVNDEHPDLYRFLADASANLGIPITRIADGRTPIELMTDEGFIGNSRKDPCSKNLKRRLMDRWCKANCNKATTIRYIGIDWSESHRLDRFRARIKPWRAEAPMCEAPYMSKAEIAAWLEREGIALPTLYKLGFSHNNCGGACIKAGQGQWAQLLKHDPERYERWEVWEGGMRERVGNHSILREQVNKVRKKLTLKDFRIRVEGNQKFDQQEIGGCGCGI